MVNETEIRKEAFEMIEEEVGWITAALKLDEDPITDEAIMISLGVIKGICGLAKVLEYQSKENACGCLKQKAHDAGISIDGRPNPKVHTVLLKEETVAPVKLSQDVAEIMKDLSDKIGEADEERDHV